MVLSRSDLEDIALAGTTNFDKFCQENGYSASKRNLVTPIDDFAQKYLGLSVAYVRLSPDGSICGITAYADTVFQISEMGLVRNIPLKQNQVLLDNSFHRPNQTYKVSGRRRFTLAHECAHQILFQNESYATHIDFPL